MTVLFGTIEYFEKEIQDKLSTYQAQHVSEEQVFMEVYLYLANDLLDDFVCDEAFRKECLRNLDKAYEKCCNMLVAL